MKSPIKLMSIALAFLAGGILTSCNNNELKQEEPLAGVPFKSISVTCDGETAEGKLVDDKNIKFTFDQAENFTAATIKVELNEGYRMTFPTSLVDIDLASTPVFNFADSKNRVVKYYIKFSSNAFPIVDDTKIQISDLEAGKGYTVDHTAKTITIKYDQDKMNYESIVIKFLEGALQEGVEVPEDLDFDFTDGIRQPLVFKLGGEREYTVVLDVSDYQKKQLSEFAFVEESSKYNLPEGSPVHVYATKTLIGVPVSQTTDTKYAPNWDGDTNPAVLYGGGNPRNWEGGLCDHNLDDDFVSLGYKNWAYDDMFCFPGDWKADRPTCNLHGRFVIVYIDREKVSVDMEGSSEGVKFGQYNNLVVVTGLENTSKRFSDYVVNIKGTTIFPASIPEEDWPTYRAAIGTKDGKLKFGVAAYKDGNILSVPVQQGPIVDRETLKANASEKWDVENAAWTIAHGIRNGKALGINEIVSNDGNDWISDGGVLGMNWSSNFYTPHAIIGTTYDNKIAIMINAPGGSNWDGIGGYQGVDNGWQVYNDKGFNFHGISLKQMFWLASQLGWKDAACIGQSGGGSNDLISPDLAIDEHGTSPYFANIKINGVGVISPSDDAGIHDRYSNNGADLPAGYVLTIDEKK